MKKYKPTESELEILKILWDRGSSNVKQINEELNLIKETGYTTTLKLMQIMFEKGVLSREKEGRTHVYTAELRKDDTQALLLDRLMNAAFGGSATSLVLRALSSKKTSKDELNKIKRLISDIEAKGDE